LEFKIKMRIRKFRKSDMREVANVKNKSYGEFNSQEYFDKKAVSRYMERTRLNKSDEELFEAFRIREGDIVYVAEERGKIIGYIKGKVDKIGNLFVLGKSHRKGVGGRLVEKFERDAKNLGSKKITIKASLYAVPFYEKMGYKKTTGIRNFSGLKIQPMVKKF